MFCYIYNILIVVRLAGVAQLVEHRICNAGVAGSSPITSFLTQNAGFTVQFISMFSIAFF